jgi:hypothetical protein
MRRLLAFTGIVGLSVGWAVMPVSAGSPSFDSSPASGPPGTIIHLSGSNCPNGDVEIVLFQGETSFQTDETFGEDDQTGSWETDMEVPDDTPPGEYGIAVLCDFVEGQFVYQDGSFTVTGDEPTSTSTTVVPAAAPSTTTTVAPVVTPAAAPVVAQPTTAG